MINDFLFDIKSREDEEKSSKTAKEEENSQFDGLDSEKTFQKTCFINETETHRKTNTYF